MNWQITYPAAGRIRGLRRTLAQRYRLWKRRRVRYDLEFLHR